MFMKPNPNRFKRLVLQGGSLGGGSGGGSSGGGGRGPTYSSGGQEGPGGGGAGGVPDFARVKENVFVTKYGERDNNNQHVTKDCIDQMMVGAVKYNKAKALGLVLDGAANAMGGSGASDSTPYKAEYQPKLTNLIAGNDLEPKTGCEQMGYNVARAADEAQTVRDKNTEIENDKKKLLDGLGKLKSTQDADME